MFYSFRKNAFDFFKKHKKKQKKNADCFLNFSIYGYSFKELHHFYFILFYFILLNENCYFERPSPL